MWAAWTIDALNYLADVDQVQGGYQQSVNGHHADIIDIAHVRWATGSAITALDLCAAALGTRYCGNSGSNEFNLRYFETCKPKLKGLLKKIRKLLPLKYRARFNHFFRGKRNRMVEARRALLPPEFLAWVDAVLADNRYKKIHGARNRFTHSWLSRNLTVGGPGGHPDRTGFKIKKCQMAINSRELVELSTELATDHVQEFFNVLDQI
jgi:hypothetical protein